MDRAVSFISTQLKGQGLKHLFHVGWSCTRASYEDIGESIALAAGLEMTIMVLPGECVDVPYPVINQDFTKYQFPAASVLFLPRPDKNYSELCSLCADARVQSYTREAVEHHVSGLILYDIQNLPFSIDLLANRIARDIDGEVMAVNNHILISKIYN